jgi:hypothetical protein
MAAGALPAGSICSSEFGQCEPGTTCDPTYHMCLKYCYEHEDCAPIEGELVTQLCVGASAAGPGRCKVLCDFESEAPCLRGTRCARFSDDGAEVELASCHNPVPVCPAPYTSNGRCDDTRKAGSRLCAYGTDPECK